MHFLLRLLGLLQVAKTQRALCLLLLLRRQSDQAALVYLPCFSGELLPICSRPLAQEMT